MNIYTVEPFPNCSNLINKTNLVWIFHIINVALVKLTFQRKYRLQSRRFDERISLFAEQKFTRDGIEVQTGCRVLSVNDKEITMKVKSTGAICSMPHGLIIWSTGISTLPVIKNFMEEIGQVLFYSMLYLKHIFPIRSSSLHACVCYEEDNQYFLLVLC